MWIALCFNRENGKQENTAAVCTQTVAVECVNFLKGGGGGGCMVACGNLDANYHIILLE